MEQRERGDLMTDAELRVVREWLGLRQADLADLLDTSERTVRNWESGKYSIPEGVRLAVEALEDAAARAVGHLVDGYADTPDDPHLTIPRSDEDARMAGHEYPAGWWRAIAARVAHEVPGLRIDYALTSDRP